MGSAFANAQWIKQSVSTTASFRGLSVVSERIIWASGTGGTVIRTIDGGKSWKVINVPGTEKLDFRDIEAFDADTAYILSIGNGESSRIYKTSDGGKTWQLEFQNSDPKAFFDSIACTSDGQCLAMSDPVDGRFVILKRRGGLVNGVSAPARWLPLLIGGPAAMEGEAAFAASGTCLIASGSSFFLVTGGKAARVLRSNDLGARWSASDSPLVRGTAGSGAFSIAMLDAKTGVIVGGDYERPADAKNNLALTTDGGVTWRLSSGLTGYRSAVAYVEADTVIAVGTNGTDLSSDGGKTWKKVGIEDLNAVAAKGKQAVWAVGPKGTVAKLK